jgi:DNA-binding Lrp family transcriptional regulator
MTMTKGVAEVAEGKQSRRTSVPAQRREEPAAPVAGVAPAPERARESITLDELDRGIVELLRRDGRRSSSSVARQLGVAKQTVAKHLDRLLKSDAIRIAARVDPVAFGFPLYCGIGVRVRPGSMARVGEQLAAMDHIAWVGLSSGSYDLLADAFLPDTDAVFEFLHERLASMPDIVETREWLVVRSAKYVYLWDEAANGAGTLRGWTTQPGSLLAPARADDLDCAIIGLLREDGRRPFTDIARRVGVTEVTVASRVDRLVRTGAMRIIAHVNWPVIGFPVDVNLSIKTARGRAEEVGERLQALSSLSFAGYTTGDYDIIAEAFLPDDAGLLAFLSEQVGAIQGVEAIDTCHILHVYKVNYMWEGERISHTALG